MKFKYALLALILAGCAGQTGLPPTPTPPENGPTTSAIATTPAATASAEPSTPSAEGPPATAAASSDPVARPSGDTVGRPTGPATTPTGRPVGESASGPPAGASWQIQYTGNLEVDDATIVNIDGADASEDVVSQVRARGGYAVCYINAGAFEPWRADASRYPELLLGRGMVGWPTERWVDIRRLDVLMPILEARMDTCRDKGFQAVDPDNVDGWAHDTGFNLTRADSVALVQALASAAHSRGLAIGLKNGIEIISQVVDTVDFAVNEQCVAHGECGAYQPFLARGKAVLHVEYEGSRDAVCSARPPGFCSVLKGHALGPDRISCP
ncbi:MAG: endo alpha-1,4 polygalactosaminidase [Propionibacteriaceae bacterium]|nr:endo alpha-1,4 polygalactosaminidase [Propionibacteriaceae bacterium]